MRTKLPPLGFYLLFLYFSSKLCSSVFFAASVYTAHHQSLCIDSTPVEETCKYKERSVQGTFLQGRSFVSQNGNRYMIDLFNIFFISHCGQAFSMYALCCKSCIKVYRGGRGGYQGAGAKFFHNLKAKQSNSNTTQKQPKATWLWV